MAEEVRNLPPLRYDWDTNSRSLYSGTIVPSVFAERFYSAIWGSMRWAPASAFVPKKLLYPGKPHTLIIILIQEEPSEELSRAEMMTLTAAMITRLEGEECLEYNTIPVSMDLRSIYLSFMQANIC